MKIVTKIEFEIISKGDLESPIPCPGNIIGSVRGELLNLLIEAGNKGAPVSVLRVESCVEPDVIMEAFGKSEKELRTMPPEVFAAWKDRLEARLDELEEEEAGEWILVTDKLPPLTVLGLCSAVCIVKQDVGWDHYLEAICHADGRWTLPDGSEEFGTKNRLLPVHAWRKKKGIIYEEPEERYADVEREGREKIARDMGM
jgi:hypothetical protein